MHIMRLLYISKKDCQPAECRYLDRKLMIVAYEVCMKTADHPYIYPDIYPEPFVEVQD